MIAATSVATASLPPAVVPVRSARPSVPPPVLRPSLPTSSSSAALDYKAGGSADPALLPPARPHFPPPNRPTCAPPILVAGNTASSDAHAGENVVIAPLMPLCTPPSLSIPSAALPPRPQGPPPKLPSPKLMKSDEVSVVPDALNSPSVQTVVAPETIIGFAASPLQDGGASVDSSTFDAVFSGMTAKKPAAISKISSMAAMFSGAVPDVNSKKGFHHARIDDGTSPPSKTPTVIPPAGVPQRPDSIATMPSTVTPTLLPSSYNERKEGGPVAIEKEEATGAECISQGDILTSSSSHSITLAESQSSSSIPIFSEGLVDADPTRSGANIEAEPSVAEVKSANVFASSNVQGSNQTQLDQVLETHSSPSDTLPALYAEGTVDDEIEPLHQQQQDSIIDSINPSTEIAGETDGKTNDNNDDNRKIEDQSISKLSSENILSEKEQDDSVARDWPPHSAAMLGESYENNSALQRYRLLRLQSSLIPRQVYYPSCCPRRI